MRNFTLIIVVFSALLLGGCWEKPKPDNHLGVGVWIWQLEKSDGGNISKIVAKAKAAHLGHVLIRVTSNGDQWATFNSKVKVRELAKELKVVGVRVFAWGYNFPQAHKKAGQIALIESVLADPVFDGYVYNVETEFSYQSKPAEALFAPIKAYRDKHFPSKLLGFSTYCRVDKGRGAEMPACTFADYCDVGMPQAYWRDFDWSPRKTIYRMCLAWGNKLNPGYVLIPTGHGYDGCPGTGTEYISAREIAEFSKASRGYFGYDVWVWERMTPEQWEVLELGWASWFAKFGANSSVDEQFEHELSFKNSRRYEHAKWTGKNIFQTHDDLVKAVADIRITAAPRWFSRSCFRLADDIGKADPSYRRQYWTATPEVWVVIHDLSEALRAEKIGSGRFRVDSLVRCVSYPLGQGSKASSHNFGGAFDIDLDSLDASELAALHRALYGLARKGAIVYYMEANTAVHKIIHTFATPYNLCLGGQMHVVALPSKQTLRRLNAGSVPVLKPAKKETANPGSRLKRIRATNQ